MSPASQNQGDSPWLLRMLLVPFVLFALIAVLMGGKLFLSLQDRLTWLGQAETVRGVVRQHLVKQLPRRFGMQEKRQLAIYYHDNNGHWHEFISRTDLTEYKPFGQPPDVGQRLWLYYLPKEPEKARLADFNAFWLPVVLELVFFLLSALLGFGPLLYLWLKRYEAPKTLPASQGH
ncbi:DUF3592 domain-containing protein [Gallaecimonas sp. GXIMD4217]|uniref:DUF3592 domain-containing protein n=1 Tax=Gallaecimonas sp. GXIMD4217 TaxID=3131927 RepID=UPI00311B3FDF